jgi:predicted metal-dependent peptidase
MKNEFSFDEIYPWYDKKPSSTPHHGGGDFPQPPSVTASGDTDGPTIRPSVSTNSPRPTQTSGGVGRQPSVTSTPTLGSSKPPKKDSQEKKPYAPKNLDDHIEIGDEPKEVLPIGDKPNAPMNDSQREIKRRQVLDDLIQRKNERSRGRSQDPLWPDSFFEFENIPTVNYKAELRRLFQNFKVVYSDKIDPISYSHGYVEYKTQKTAEKLSVVIAIDTSGSVIDKAKDFLNEAYKIAMIATKIELCIILFNDGVYAKGVLKNKAELQNFISAMQREIADGGTLMSPVARVVSDYILQNKISKKSAVIYLTDGLIEQDCVLSTLVKANFIYVIEGGTLDHLLSLKEKHHNLKIAYINI